MSDMTSSRLLEIEEMSRFLGVSESTLYGWVNQKRIPFIKVGRLVRFNAEEIENWLKERSVAERK